MKKFTFFTQKLQGLSFIAIFLLVISGIVFSCKPDPEPEPTPKDEPEIEYPIDVPFEVYKIDPCKWFVCPDPGSGIYQCDRKLLIINSYEEMEEYYQCTGGNTVPDIDFSRYTLLLARDIHPTGLRDYYPESFTCLASDSYSLNVRLRPTETGVFSYWCVSIITDKLSRDVNVELVVQ